jgi:hypothetical protein
LVSTWSRQAAKPRPAGGPLPAHKCICNIKVVANAFVPSISPLPRLQIVLDALG